jgi:hypothetical protein
MATRDTPGFFVFAMIAMKTVDTRLIGRQYGYKRGEQLK